MIMLSVNNDIFIFQSGCLPFVCVAWFHCLVPQVQCWIEVVGADSLDYLLVISERKQSIFFFSFLPLTMMLAGAALPPPFPFLPPPSSLSSPLLPSISLSLPPSLLPSLPLSFLPSLPSYFLSFPTSVIIFNRKRHFILLSTFSVSIGIMYFLFFFYFVNMVNYIDSLENF